MNTRDREARFRIETKVWDGTSEEFYFLDGQEIFTVAEMLMHSHGHSLPERASLRTCMKVMVTIQNLAYVKTYREYLHCSGRSYWGALASPLIEYGTKVTA